MKYRIVHTTKYTSPEPVSVGYNEAWLTPRSTPTQTCHAHRIEIEPAPSIRLSRVDYFQNTTTQFAFNQGYDVLSVTSISEVEVHPSARLTVGQSADSQVQTFDSQSQQQVGNLSSLAPSWELVHDAVQAHRTPEDFAALEYTFESPRCRVEAEFRNYAQSSFPAGASIINGITDLMQRFHADFQYDPTATTVSTPVEQVFRLRRGVCQDFAHLLIAMLRSLGLPARYVSGYLRTLPPVGKPRLVGADASHAWVSVYCGPLGWVDLDPTNNQFPSTDHITIAWGRDYMDVAPLKGVYIGGGTSPHLAVSVDVCEIERF